MFLTRDMLSVIIPSGLGLIFVIIAFALLCLPDNSSYEKQKDRIKLSIVFILLTAICCAALFANVIRLILQL